MTLGVPQLSYCKFGPKNVSVHFLHTFLDNIVCVTVRLGVLSQKAVVSRGTGIPKITMQTSTANYQLQITNQQRMVESKCTAKIAKKRCSGNGTE